ncbi:prephenate dehydrogenase [Legionella shakespearei]|uniref:Prephenate dehydrogenase n=1 Tax=Legionella shakespearei DSM 23087 TaxID=1122169 RepID=A0A0W0YZV4_9GAMM|nr:prephenate dehydrogenase/arogenate dehydrogenase family protein [Legionella shakespearei]KTD62395.1 prephenate dehydrogenase [Legionella shakespearei DSM 23087]
MKVLIWGCGRIGGSIAKSINALNKDEKKIEIDGYDENPTLDSGLASQLGCFSKLHDNMPDSASLSEYDVIFICTPIDSFENIAKYLQDKVGDKTEVVDVGSRKSQSVDLIRKHLPNNYFPIHPMVGGSALNVTNKVTIVSDYEGFSAQFFDKKTIFTFPSSQTCQGAHTQELIERLGGRLVNTTTQEHDSICALTSHLPQALAAVFWFSFSQSSIHPKDKSFDFTSKKILDPMWLPIFLNNEFIAQRFKEFQIELQRLKTLHLKDNAFNDQELVRPTEVKALEAFIVKTIENLKNSCDSPIRDNACGRGYQVFIEAGFSLLEQYIAQADKKSLALVLHNFTNAIDIFLSVMKNQEQLREFLEEAHACYDYKPILTKNTSLD